MKLYGIVFSPTGGTQKAAALLTDALGGEVTHVDLTDGKQDFHAVSLTKEDTAVISVPSYAGRVPSVAVERLTMLNGQGARAILVCVYGNRAYEDTLVELEDAAKQAGFQVVAAVAAVAEHRLHGSLPPAGPTRRMRSSFLSLQNRFRASSPREIFRSPRSPAAARTKRPPVPVWYRSLQRSVRAAASVRQNVLYRPSTRKIRKKWMKRHVSPVCAVFLYALIPPAESIRLCSPPSA